MQKLGDNLFDQERLQEARNVYEESIAINPNLGKSYLGIAQILASEKKYKKADKWFQRAITKNPEKKWWYLYRANAARGSMNYSLAIELYDEIILRFPNFAQAYYEISWAYKKDQKTDLAISAIKAAIGKSKSPNQLYFIRAGKIYEWTGDLEDAVASYNRALEINSKNKTAIQSLKRLGE